MYIPLNDSIFKMKKSTTSVRQVGKARLKSLKLCFSLDLFCDIVYNGANVKGYRLGLFAGILNFRLTSLAAEIFLRCLQSLLFAGKVKS